MIGRDTVSIPYRYTETYTETQTERETRPDQNKNLRPESAFSSPCGSRSSRAGEEGKLRDPVPNQGKEVMRPPKHHPRTSGTHAKACPWFYPKQTVVARTHNDTTDRLADNIEDLAKQVDRLTDKVIRSAAMRK
jgi:hypothetical protein